MNKQTIAVIDGGGRGSALVYKYSKSPHVGRILAIPGNDSMKLLTKKVSTFPGIKPIEVEKIISLCKSEKVSLIDVAQDNAIEVGLADKLEENNFLVVGPTRKAGELEWNKAWARSFMKKYNIAQPEFFIFHSEKAGTLFLRKRKDQKWFVKASGLCEGKGALPAYNNNQAIVQIKNLKKFGKAGSTYLLENWLEGDKSEELSAFFMCNGERAFLIGTAQDHKRASNFDEGENTGGMGCIVSPLIATKEILNQIQEIADKTILGLKKEKRSYKGILYIGCMVASEKSKKKVFVIEYNARWGDPEAQVLVPQIKNDLYILSKSVSLGKKFFLKLNNQKSIVVAGVSRGYPSDYSQVKGKEIFGIENVLKNKKVLFFGAGIKTKNNKYIANGGRLFYLVASGKNILEAREKAYSQIAKIYIQGNNLHFRTDIGWHDQEKFYDT